MITIHSISVVKWHGVLRVDMREAPRCGGGQ